LFTTPELWLAATLWALFLADSLRLVHIDEVLVEVDLLRSPSLAVHVPAARLRIGRRYLTMLPPFTPHAPVFVASWMVRDGEVSDPGVRALARARLLRTLAAPSILLWATLLFGVPSWLYIDLPSYGVLLLALVLGCEFVLLRGLVRLRGPLGLSGLQTAQLAFECLVCPPNAINLPRKLAPLQQTPADLQAWVAENPKAMAIDHRARLLERIAESLDLLDDDDPRRRRLNDIHEVLSVA